MAEDRETNPDVVSESESITPPEGTVMFGTAEARVRGGLVHMRNKRFPIHAADRSLHEEVDGLQLFFEPSAVSIDVKRRGLTAEEINTINQLRIDAAVISTVGAKITQLSELMQRSKTTIQGVEGSRTALDREELDRFATSILSDIGLIQEKLLASGPLYREKYREVLSKLDSMGIDTIHDLGNQFSIAVKLEL